MQNPLISVIIPIYNVERYLPQCLDSVINQDYRNLEIILIDDASPDKSAEICEAYALKDNRVKVIRKERNGGQSESRNMGLEIAHGELISFIDSDDFIDVHYYTTMVQELLNNSLQVIECSVNGIYNDKVVKPAVKGLTVLTGNDALSLYLKNQKVNFPRTAVWNKLYRKEIVESLRFPVGKIHEEYVFTVTAFFRCSKYGLLQNPLYNHRYNNPFSTTNAKFSVRDLSRAEQKLAVMNLVHEKGSHEQYLWAAANYYKECVTIFYKSFYNALYEESNKIRQIFKSEWKKVFASKLEKIKKIEIVFIMFFPKFYLFARKKISSVRKIG